MKRTLSKYCFQAAIALCGLCSLSLNTMALAAADISGDWQLVATNLDDVSFARVTLKIEGDKLTGTLNELKLEGTLKGDELTFTGKRPNGDHGGDFTGKVRGDTLEGTRQWAGGKMTWSAKRPAVPAKEPRIHNFEPTQFHR